jgi:hypothetical protein
VTRIGQRFGRWTVTGRQRSAGSTQQRRPYVRCRCVCGATQLVMVHNLLTNKTGGCMACAGHRKLEKQSRGARMPVGARISDLAWLPEPTVQLTTMARW